MVISGLKNGVVSKPIVHPHRPHRRRDQLSQNCNKYDPKCGSDLSFNQTC